MKIALASPGAMGASIGQAAVCSGHEVFWQSSGRSPATRQRAEQAGLQEARSQSRFYQEAELLLSICPPAAAEAVAAEALAAGFKGIYCEANAISPERTRQLAARLSDEGVDYVDGGIIGGPVAAGSDTCLYLSGPYAEQVAACFTESLLATRVMDERVGAASAVKMAFAAHTKGVTALLAAILAVAEAEGVRDTLEERWGEKFTRGTHKRLCSNTAKAWRFAGEMEEIAATFAAAGQPEGFHLASAEVFQHLAGFKHAPAENLTELLAALSPPAD